MFGNRFHWSGVLLTTLLVTTACQPIQRLPPTQSGAMAATETGTEQANRAVVQRFYDEVFTQKKMPVLDEIFNGDPVIHDLDVGGELPGGDLPETLAAFPDVVATVNQWVVDGDLVAAYITFNGTHQGEFLGVAPTGKAVTWSIIDLWRVQDGKMVELWHNIPNDDILEQIDGSGPQTSAAAPAATGEQDGSSTVVSGTVSSAANQAVVQRFYDEVFTGKQLTVLAELFDPNLAIHDLDVGGELGGATLLEDTLTAFPDVKATIHLWAVEGDLVTAYVTYQGTHQAEFLGVAPTGKAVTWAIIDLWRVKDGKIVELWHNVPNEDILEQIGSPED
jgi:predicted ester cyclase